VSAHDAHVPRVAEEELALFDLLTKHLALVVDDSAVRTSARSVSTDQPDTLLMRCEFVKREGRVST
jgi:hypothetical protein